jgi:nicotinamidase-related amidase
LQKDFVDPAESRLALPAGKAILPVVAQAVAVAREHGLFVVWVGSLLPFSSVEPVG